MADINSPLRESWLKLRRGKEHFYALDAEFRKFWDAEPYSVVHEYDLNQSKNLFRFKMLEPIPHISWGLRIGDVVHNARTALDYIAWRLAGSDLADIYTQFPIYLTPDKFDNARWRLEKRKRIHSDAIAEMAKLQPYTRPRANQSALWLLQELDARDKHKLITVTQQVTKSSSVTVEDPIPVTIPYLALDRIQHDTIVAEWPGMPNPDVNMQIEFSFEVLFERGFPTAGDEYAVSDSLLKVFDIVAQVIGRFEWLLKRNPHWIPKP